jgi:hypothetical protein
VESGRRLAARRVRVQASAAGGWRTVGDDADLRVDLAHHVHQLLKLLGRHDGQVVHKDDVGKAGLHLRLLQVELVVAVSQHAHGGAASGVSACRRAAARHWPARPAWRRVHARVHAQVVVLRQLQVVGAHLRPVHEAVLSGASAARVSGARSQP